MEVNLVRSHCCDLRKDKLVNYSEHVEVATLGGGCFWCTEAIFSEIKGVVKVEPGYSGGSLANPNYEQVSTGTTGHAEVVQITFDKNIISFRALLGVFFATHDPTTLNRQGADVGTQYRSVVFYHNAKQKDTVKKFIEELNNTRIYGAPIVTKVEPFKAFYKAESYHKDYFRNHLEEPYCRLLIAPKIAKLRKKYRDRIK